MTIGPDTASFYVTAATYPELKQRAEAALVGLGGNAWGYSLTIEPVVIAQGGTITLWRASVDAQHRPAPQV